MKQIVVFSCTNRPNSYTSKVSNAYANILKSLGYEAKLLDFNDLPEKIAFSETFNRRSEAFEKLIDEYVRNQNKFIFISPEYNGSYPGILKVFLDSVPPREWLNKNACLVGVSNGRAGNLRGMDHLTGVLNYLKMHVYHNKLPISSIDKMISDSSEFLNEDQTKVCVAQVKGFLELPTN